MSIFVKDNPEFDGPSEEFNAAMGARLKEIRTRLGISQKDLTTLTGDEISQSNISALETGKRTWSSRHLLVLSMVMGVSPQDFLPQASAEEAQEPTQEQMMEASLVRAFREGRAGDVAAVALMMAEKAGRDQVASVEWTQHAEENRRLRGELADLQITLDTLRDQVASEMAKNQVRFRMDPMSYTRYGGYDPTSFSIRDEKTRELADKKAQKILNP
jgi:transcriptional regulator with XRE-family HTH domain